MQTCQLHNILEINNADKFIKLTFTLNDVSRVAQELIRTLRRFIAEHNLAYDHILVSMPRPFNTALGWYMNGHTMDAPKEFRGIKIIPAHENKITVFCPDYQLFEGIKPISIELNNPDLYA